MTVLCTYTVKAGLSLVDIGSVSFTKIHHSYLYSCIAESFALALGFDALEGSVSDPMIPATNLLLKLLDPCQMLTLLLLAN